MALAEAIAAWQRIANRCFVQEDAKSAACGLHIPTTGSLPFNLNPSCSNLSPNSKWWLQLPPNYVYKKGLMDEQFDSVEGNMESCQMHEIVKDPFNLYCSSHLNAPGILTAVNSSRKLSMSAKDQIVSTTDKPLREFWKEKLPRRSFGHRPMGHFDEGRRRR